MIAATVASSALTAGNIKPNPTRAEEVADFLKARRSSTGALHAIDRLHPSGPSILEPSVVISAPGPGLGEEQG